MSSDELQGAVGNFRELPQSRYARVGRVFSRGTQLKCIHITKPCTWFLVVVFLGFEVQLSSIHGHPTIYIV